MFTKQNRVERFENELTEKQKVHYSRYIVSWMKEVLRNPDMLICSRIEIIFGDDFKDWLQSEGLTEEEISNVVWMATNGKLELESSALRFIKSL